MKKSKIEAVIMSDKSNVKKDGKPTMWLPSGNTLFDLLIGGGQGLGFPVGFVVNLVGNKSSGKTFVATELIASCYHNQKNIQKQYPILKNFRWCYDDGESGYTFDTQNLYNFDIFSSPDNRSSGTIQDFSYNYGKFLDSMQPGDYGVYVLDSLDGVGSNETNERDKKRMAAMDKGKEFTDGSYNMQTAKFLSSEFFKTRIEPTKAKNVLLIIISQVRDKVGGISFDKNTRSGGRALDFYCHTILWLYHMQDIIVKGRAIGDVIKAKNKKSKTPRPRRSVIIPFLFSYGVDSIAACVDFLYDLRTKTGELSSFINNILIGPPVTMLTVKEFLTENKKLTAYITYRKDTVGKSTITKDTAIQWINENEVLKKKFSEKFQTVSREELIQSAIADPEYKAKIIQDTIQKWEDIEESILPQRGKKYDQIK